jgi:hypothetical protein
MGKRDPDGAKLRRLVGVLEKWNSRIKKIYRDIVSSFEKSA